MKALPASTLKGKRLTVQEVRRSVSAIAQHIQDEKIRLSRHRIGQFQARGQWPAEYVSYSGPVGRNSFKDPDVFFRTMRGRPHKYRQRFVFLPARDPEARQLQHAADMALDIVSTQSQKYGVQSGMYGRSFRMYMREGNNRKHITSIAQLDKATPRTIFEITNPVAYASTVEANALYRAKIGGVLYYAAKRLQRAFPGLGVRYVYHKSEEFGFGHKYDVPVLSIGSRKVVQDRLRRPGVNARRRNRIKGKLRALR